MSSKLREEFTNHLILQRYSPKTREAYINAVTGLSRYHMKSPDKLSNDEIQEYLMYLIEEKKLAWSTCNVAFSGLNYFYTNILEWDETRFTIPRRPRIKTIPMIMSVEEVERLINTASNLKHRAILKTVYSAGLRAGEVVRLKPRHIESDPSRMMIRVEQGKGRKDRIVPLPQCTLQILREHYKTHRNEKFIFPAPGRAGIYEPKSNIPLPDSSIQTVLKKALRQTGIIKNVSVHNLRHSYATHLLEAGIDIRIIQKYLGHKSISATMIYTHLTPIISENVHQKVDRLMSDLW